MHCEVEHDIIDFRQISGAQSVLQFENVVFLADSNIFFDNVRCDFTSRRQSYLELLEFGEYAGQVVPDMFA